MQPPRSERYQGERRPVSTPGVGSDWRLAVSAVRLQARPREGPPTRSRRRERPRQGVSHRLNVVGRGLAITPDLAIFLLRKNHETPFGALSLRDDDEIAFRHILFGESVTKDTLSMLLRLLAAYSDEIEDELNMRFR
jgi:hypothetical protein